MLTIILKRKRNKGKLDILSTKFPTWYKPHSLPSASQPHYPNPSDQS